VSQSGHVTQLFTSRLVPNAVFKTCVAVGVS
jgi:hypothetical protein